MKLPDDLERRPDYSQEDLMAELSRHTNLLIFGRPERGDENEPGESTPFRAVVIVAAALGEDQDGNVTPMAFGALNADARCRQLVLPKLVERLRSIARDMEAMIENQRTVQ